MPFAEAAASAFQLILLALCGLWPDATARDDDPVSREEENEKSTFCRGTSFKRRSGGM